MKLPALKPMGSYGGGWVQKMLNIQQPAKLILRKMGLGSISLEEAQVLIQLLKEVSALPRLERDKVRNPNTIILLDTWEESKRHLTKDFLNLYEPILDVVVNFIASKFDYDGFYEGLGNWFLGEMIRRGWQFPGHNRPNSILWDGIPLATRARLVQSLQSNYELLQTRLKSIDDKLSKDDPVGNAQRASRFEQFVNRVLVDVEREGVAWH